MHQFVAKTVAKDRQFSPIASGASLEEPNPRPTHYERDVSVPDALHQH